MSGGSRRIRGAQPTFPEATLHAAVSSSFCVKPVIVSVTVPTPRQEVYDFLDVLANHEAFVDHLLIDWSYSGPRSGVGAWARARTNTPASQEWIEIEVVEA